MEILETTQEFRQPEERVREAVQEEPELVVQRVEQGAQPAEQGVPASFRRRRGAPSYQQDFSFALFLADFVRLFRMYRQIRKEWK